MPKLYRVTYDRIIKEEKTVYAENKADAIKMVRDARKRFGEKARDYKAEYVGLHDPSKGW